MAAKAKATSSGARSDAYTGILILSLLAQLIGGGFLFWDYMRLTTPSGPPESVNKVVARPGKLTKDGAPSPQAPPAPPAPEKADPPAN